MYPPGVGKFPFPRDFWSGFSEDLENWGGGERDAREEEEPLYCCCRGSRRGPIGWPGEEEEEEQAFRGGRDVVPSAAAGEGFAHLDQARGVPEEGLLEGSGRGEDPEHDKGQRRCAAQGTPGGDRLGLGDVRGRRRPPFRLQFCQAWRGSW